MSTLVEHNVRFDNKCEIINKSNTSTLMCSSPSCKKDLIILHTNKMEDVKVKYNLRVECPFCGRRAFDFEVDGDLKYIPCEDVIITNAIEDIANNLVTFKTMRV